MEKLKDIKYLIALNVIFIVVCIISCCVIINNKSKKCDCPKCEITNNENTVQENKIDEKNDNKYLNNTDLSEMVKNVAFHCLDKEEGYCLLADTNNKVELKNISNNSVVQYNSIFINGNEYSLDGNDGIYHVKETDDKNVFLEYVHDSEIYYILLDENARKLTDFKEMYEDGYKNRIYYINYNHDGDGNYVVYSHYDIGNPYVSAFNYCGLVDDDKIIEIEKEYRYNELGNFEMVSKKTYTTNEAIERDKEHTRFASCEEYLNNR